MNRTSLVLTGAVVLLSVFLGVAVYILAKKLAVPAGDQKPQSQEQEQGKSGRKDEPSAVTEPGDIGAGWLTYTDSKKVFSFKYQANFGANVWQPIQWPPAAVLVGAGQDPVATGCGDIHDNMGKVPVGVAGKTDSGVPYSLYIGSDIGAGQLYSNYCYVYERSTGGAAVINFAIKSHSACGFDGCGAYCGTQYEFECTNLDRKKAIEEPIARMAATFVFNAEDNELATTTMEVPTEVREFSGKTVTLADNQTNVALEAGNVFLLDLSDGYAWNPVVVDNTIVDRENDISVVRGAQGFYRALRVGDTDLTATGDPVCRNSIPPCAMPSVFFTVHVAVR